MSKEKNVRVAKWLLGIRLVCLKHSSEDAAKALDVSATEVRRWVHRFNNGGIEAMRPDWSPGRPARLNEEQMERLRERIRNGPTENDGFSTWRGHFVRDVLRDEFGVEYKLTGVYKLLHRLGFSSIMPRAKNPDSSEKEQDDLKKTLYSKPTRQSAAR